MPTPALPTPAPGPATSFKFSPATSDSSCKGTVQDHPYTCGVSNAVVDASGVVFSAYTSLTLIHKPNPHRDDDYDENVVGIGKLNAFALDAAGKPKWTTPLINVSREDKTGDIGFISAGDVVLSADESVAMVRWVVQCQTDGIQPNVFPCNNTEHEDYREFHEVVSGLDARTGALLWHNDLSCCARCTCGWDVCVSKSLDVGHLTPMHPHELWPDWGVVWGAGGRLRN